MNKIVEKIDFDAAYKKALLFTRNHYENFPVASFLVKKELRKHIAVIYWFARTADDIADEGNVTEAERIIKLNDFEERLQDTLAGHFENDFDAALYHTITGKKLTHQLFFDLISAFRQDITKKRYNNYEELLDYCSRSANPVGRLILELHDIRDSKAFSYSDNICTALQLTNFYQDVSVDIEKGRIYIALDEMSRYKVSEKLFENKEINQYIKSLMQFNVERVSKMFSEGKNLLDYLNGRLKFEIAWTILGGMEILNMIKANDYDVMNKRPELSKNKMISLFFKALVYGSN
jgi:squalene synthase HpnC